MAHIIKLLQKEVDKGNIFIDNSGRTFNMEKLVAMARKEYKRNFDAVAIAENMTFEAFAGKFSEQFTQTFDLMEAVMDAVSGEAIIPDPEEPEAPAEPVPDED